MAEYCTFYTHLGYRYHGGSDERNCEFFAAVFHRQCLDPCIHNTHICGMIVGPCTPFFDNYAVWLADELDLTVHHKKDKQCS